METIRLHKSFYAPGDRVEGQAVISIKKTPKNVVLSFCGRETTSWSSKDISGSNKLFEEKVCILDNYSAKSESTYVVPFTFLIPKGIPDSFTFKGEENGGSFAKIWYEVCVSEDHSTEDDIVAWRSFDEEVIVRNPVPGLEVYCKPASDPHQEVRIMSCCCFHKGNVYGDLSLDQSAYKPGDWISFKANIGQTKAGLVREVKAEFLSVVQVSKTHDLISHTSVGWSEESECKVLWSREIAKEDVGNIEIRVQVPTDALPTVMGAIARRFHCVKLTVDSPSTFYTILGMVVVVLPSETVEALPISMDMTGLGRHEVVATVELKLPTFVNVDGQPGGLLGNFFIPELVAL